MGFRLVHEFPEPGALELWRDFLLRVDCPSHYLAPEYFLEPYWGGCKPFAVLALHHGGIIGVLSGLHQGDQVTCGFESRPQICLDPAAETAAAIDALLEGLQAEAKASQLVTVYTWADLRLDSFLRHGFRCRPLAGNVVLDLTKGADALFKEFTKDRRRNIRFAEKNGVEVTEATTPEDVSEAFQIYQTWWHQQEKQLVGNPPSREIFEQAAQLRNNRLLLVARVSGKPIAINTFRFFPGGLFESAANSSLAEFQHLKPNDLLQWRGIQWACAHGLRRHSLGGSHAFLLRFGGQVVPVLRYRRDCTWLHRHDLREATRDYSRRILNRMPAGVEQRVRRMLK